MSPAVPSSRSHARPLRMRLLLLAAGAMLPLVLLLAWGIDHLIEEQRAESFRSVQELSRALGTAVDAELRSVEAVLDNLATSPELEAADLRGFYLAARKTAEQFGWKQVILIDAEGHALMRTADPFGTVSPTILDMETVRRVIETQAPAVSPLLPSPRDPNTEAFAVRVPVMRSGKVVYVLSAVLPSEIVLNVLVRQKIPESTVVAVFDQRQTRIARSRPSSQKKPSSSLKQLLDRGDLQGTGITRTVEGVESYTGYSRLPVSGWSVVVGNSISATNKGLSGLLGAASLGLAGSLALAVLLAWWLAGQVIEPIEALKRSAAALGRGEPVVTPEIDIVELEEVAQALQLAARERDQASLERESLHARIRDALRQAEEASLSKDQFMAMLGHELRNPLAPITTAVQIMAIKGDESTAAERRVIERQLVHVTRLVDDLLDISRITSRRLAIRREPVRMGPLLAQVVETIRPSVYQASIGLEIGPGVDACWVSGDEVRLVQVFNNLLVNAIKFTPAGGSIHVRARTEGGELLVDVEDTGTGIDPRHLEKIFDLFYQAPQSYDRSRGGLGLGLPIVRSLVEMQGGSVRAESSGAGTGSRFTVRLPLCDAPAGELAVNAGAAAAGQGRVLVVDDNEDAADTCASLLEMTGYTVRTAYLPEEAIAILAEFTPDLAILDIGLPGMNGYQLAAKLREAGYRGRLVAMTGYGQASDKQLAESQGFDAHLTKPVGPPELLAMVSRMVNSEIAV